MRARAEYATAKIAVWWDMKDCPIPDWYDASQIRQRLEGAFMERGYSGPVSITAYGDQTKTCDFNLKGLFYTGVSVAHTRSESIKYVMHRDMVEWRGQNPPPATMMIISDELQGVFDWDLLRLQQRTRYNLFLAYSFEVPNVAIILSTSAEWCWKRLLNSKPSRLRAVQCAKLYCSSCNFDCRNVNKFKKHLSSYKHLRQEDVNPTCDEVIRVTESWGMNYKATPEYATAKIQVWWDMIACPLPQGYDARRVRPSLEAAFKELGYSGPVSITAYADHNHTPLQALSSTGVDAVHVVPYFTGVSSDVQKWHDKNPPQAAAIMMIISNHVHLPTKMSFLLTSAEWLWDRLLSVSEKSAQFLQKCSESESGEPRAMFYCKFCSFATKSIDNFRTHLSTDEAHAQEEKRIPAYHYSTIESHRLARVTQYRRDHCRETKRYRKSKRMKKAIRTGFGLLHNQLLLTNQR
ncbi:zinc finger protein-related [Raphanus sativus]|nr:zinc finger protein-related [Raphanus sativus]KAJ4898107.1 zinc finger protein-related [Raphanus sativus]